ncbi:hypothetical protein N6B72_04860 [Chryseobacterium soli]|uniref:hypothetical protein n=1 Tax=Chryseobacterium soli TaxID=445961 RepID=UPI002953B396|nr:hypothetical protein [Chryseobacterium soli]MDV7696248.1 hypothetical protein [Chryseobacterium soli]
MKKILFLFIPIAFFAQERVLTSSGKSVILNTDYTWKYDDKETTGLNPADFKTTNDKITAGLLNKIKYPVKNGEDQIVNIDFSYISTVEDFNKISTKKIEDMIESSRVYVMLKLKNKYSFIPRKAAITFSNSQKKWAVMWEYTAKNSYGGETEGNAVVLYDNDLNRVGF